LRYSQNRRCGRSWDLQQNVRCIYAFPHGGDGSTRPVAKTPPQPIAITLRPAMQSQLSFLMPFADDRLHLRESPQFVRLLIGELVVEVFVMVVVVVVFSLWLSQNIQNIMWLRKIFRIFLNRQLGGACQTLALFGYF